MPVFLFSPCQKIRKHAKRILRNTSPHHRYFSAEKFCITALGLLTSAATPPHSPPLIPALRMCPAHSHPQHFAKFRSRSVFLHSASFAAKTLWRSAERSPALLLQQKLCATAQRRASARGTPLITDFEKRF